MALEPDEDPRAQLRASDADRQAVVEQLRTYVAEGRLTMAEFEERSSATYASRTYGDLWRVTSDLPAPTPARTASGPPVRQRPEGRAPQKHPHLLSGVTGTLIVINGFLVLIWLLTSPGGYFWPIWPILGCLLVIGLVTVNRRA